VVRRARVDRRPGLYSVGTPNPVTRRFLLQVVVVAVGCCSRGRLLLIERLLIGVDLSVGTVERTAREGLHPQQGRARRTLSCDPNRTSLDLQTWRVVPQQGKQTMGNAEATPADTLRGVGEPGPRVITATQLGQHTITQEGETTKEGLDVFSCKLALIDPRPHSLDLGKVGWLVQEAPQPSSTSGWKSSRDTTQTALFRPTCHAWTLSPSLHGEQSYDVRRWCSSIDRLITLRFRFFFACPSELPGISFTELPEGFVPPAAEPVPLPEDLKGKQQWVKGHKIGDRGNHVALGDVIMPAFCL
jgi:hypothetical protein